MGLHSLGCTPRKVSIFVEIWVRELQCAIGRIATVYPLVISTVRYGKNGPFVVDLPIDSMVIFHSYVKLPEGTW